MENVLGPAPFTLLYDILTKSRWQSSWSFLGDFLFASLLNPHYKSIDSVPGIPLASPSTFLYKTFIETNGK